MKRRYLIDFLDSFAYPQAAKTALLNAYQRLTDGGKAEEFFRYVQEYETGALSYDDGINAVRNIAKETDIHEYTLILLYLIYLADVLKANYLAGGIDEQIWFDTVADLKYKALDCEGLYGVWGTKDAPWHRGFFAMKKFGFRKLQFEPANFGAVYNKNGVDLKEDSPVLYVHVPRTGEKLDYEGVQDAYKKAAAFYKRYLADRYGDKRVVFVFRSWMLFEKHKEVMKPTSNFMRFCADYDVFEKGEYPDYTSVWRVFYRFYEGDISVLPTDTSLQRAYIDIIANNEKTGWGWGVYAPEFTKGEVK
ncbi:MAG: DUF5596 domain-containing protein [Clostridia bacterium]|nr:DUF5596 domain-containing protein [Clostridia bacterium]